MKSMPALHDVFQARARIAPVIHETPLIPSPGLAEKTGAAQVFLKLECLQNTGSFKVRGAANKILSLSPEERRRGVIAFSTGNHGKAVAYVARQVGVRAAVCLSEHVAAYRADMIRDLGAEVVRKGQSQDEAEAHYRNMAAEQGLTPVVPFDDPMIIAGQGTLALEMLSAAQDINVLAVQLSGGGLLAGIALAAKSVNPNIHIVGVSLERSPAMLESLKAGRPVPVTEKDSVADSLLGGIGAENHFTLPLVRRFVDVHVTVSEEEVMDGMFYMFESHRLIAEGAAAAGVGALLHGKLDVKGKNAALVLSGSSVASDAYIKIIQERLSRAGGS